MNRFSAQTRSETGARQADALGITIPASPQTPVEASWRDFVFSEIWVRGGIDRRSRFIIAIVGSANTIGPPRILEGYVRGALSLGELTLVELREIALHMTAYVGWSQAAGLDDVITRVAEELGLEPVELPPLSRSSWTVEERLAHGAESFREVMTIAGSASFAPFVETNVLNYVFAELWTREGLDRRSRRLVTLTGAADSQAPRAVRSHVYAAMASGDLSKDEMCEFVMQYAIHGGHTRASTMQSLIFEMAEQIEMELRAAS